MEDKQPEAKDIKDSRIYVVPKNLDEVIEITSNRINISKQVTLRSAVVAFDFLTRHLTDGWQCKLHKEGQEDKEIKFVKDSEK